MERTDEDHAPYRRLWVEEKNPPQLGLCVWTGFEGIERLLANQLPEYVSAFDGG